MYQLIVLSGLKRAGHGSLKEPYHAAVPREGLSEMSACSSAAGLRLQAAEGHRVRQPPEQGQALHPTAPSGMGRGEPEKGCQPKRWLLSRFSMVKCLCVQPMTVK